MKRKRKNLLTTPLILNMTDKNLDKVNLSPLDDGKKAANTNVKKLDVELNNVTIAVSVGSSAN